MCGRFDLTLPIGRVAATYGVEVPAAYPGGPRHNIVPTQETAIVIGEGGKASEKATVHCCSVALACVLTGGLPPRTS